MGYSSLSRVACYSRVVPDPDPHLVPFYAGKLAEHGDSSQAVGMSARSQRARFEALLTLGDLRGRTVLDLGCGLAHFADFLRERDVDCHYIGVDIAADLIGAARVRRPELDLRVDDALACNIEADYVVANGLLGIWAGDDPGGTMQALIARSYAHCRLGCVVTMGSVLSGFAAIPGGVEYDPSAMLAYALTLTRAVRLDHTYLPHDFALFLYRSALTKSP
jgi:SAM-dependent methyltransferase